LRRRAVLDLLEAAPEDLVSIAAELRDALLTTRFGDPESARRLAESLTHRAYKVGFSRGTVAALESVDYAKLARRR
jgi:hypothetical protein